MDGYQHTPVSVADKRAVVIGGTSGIGRAVALGFASEGADVVASSRDSERVARTAADLRERGATTTERPCDVTDAESLSALRDGAVEAMGGVDTLVVSASAIARTPVDEVDEDDWAAVLDVQLTGVYRALRAFAPVLREAGGSVVAVSSLSAVVGIEELAAYSAAKGGVESLVRAAAADLGTEIRVNAVRPGFVATPQTADAYAEGTLRRERVEARAGRIADPSDVVGAVVYLASDAADYVTGEVVTVDGGFAQSALR